MSDLTEVRDPTGRLLLKVSADRRVLQIKLKHCALYEITLSGPVPQVRLIEMPKKKGRK